MKKTLQLLFLLYVAFFLAMVSLKGVEKFFFTSEANHVTETEKGKETSSVVSQKVEPVPRREKKQGSRNSTTNIFIELPEEGTVHRAIYLSCKAETETYCSQTQSLDQLEDCLLENRKSLKDRCASLIGNLHDGYKPCQSDLEKFCKGSKVFDSKAILCLKENRSKLSKICDPLMEI